VLGVWRTFPEQDDSGEDEVQSDMYHDGDPNQDAEAFRKVEHEDVCTNAQLYQCHAVKIEELANPKVSHVFLQICGVLEDGVPNVPTASIFGHDVAAYCASDSQSLIHISLRFLSFRSSRLCLHDLSTGSDLSKE
jgi:hypothetical protein